MFGRNILIQQYRGFIKWYKETHSTIQRIVQFCAPYQTVAIVIENCVFLFLNLLKINNFINS